MLFTTSHKVFADTLYSNDFTSQADNWKFVLPNSSDSIILTNQGLSSNNIAIGVYETPFDNTHLLCESADMAITTLDTGGNAPFSAGQGLFFWPNTNPYNRILGMSVNTRMYPNIIIYNGDSILNTGVGPYNNQLHNYKFCIENNVWTAYIDGTQIATSLTTTNDNFNYPGIGIDGYNTSSYATNFKVEGTPSNQPPSVNTISNATINEGDTFTASGSFTDPDSTNWTATVDYGDGLGSQALTLSGTNFSLSHQYKDNGTYTVTVNVTDNQGATGTGTATGTVNNVAPTVGTISASVNPVQVNTATTASANFTDPGVLDTHTASWNWGDGNTTTGTVTESNGSGSVSDSHTYTSAGVYQITLTVTDKDGGQGSQSFQYVSVYNPTSQGLFSAGQKYTSPAGAYAANTSLTGNVKFGLSYKYQGTVATGTRQFSMDFNTANLHFNATTVSSLVIANGMGTLTGTGTINNGTTTYNFLVTGSESANTIRIQITDSSNNVIYDTQPSAADTATPTTAVTGNVLAH